MSDEVYEQCPYDPNHKILRSRMMYHITKCKRNVNTFPKPKNRGQGAAPQNKHSVESSESEDQFLATLVEKSLPEIPLPKSEEDWDTEEAEVSYDPSSKIETKPVLRNLAVASKSERKAFKREERLRFSALEMEEREANKIGVAPKKVGEEGSKTGKSASQTSKTGKSASQLGETGKSTSTPGKTGKSACQPGKTGKSAHGHGKIGESVHQAQ